MNKYILFLLFGLSANISYSMNPDEARELKKREREEQKLQKQELQERVLRKKYFCALTDALIDSEQAERYGDPERAKKFQEKANKIRRAGWQGQKDSACCIIL